MMMEKSENIIKLSPLINYQLRPGALSDGWCCSRMQAKINIHTHTQKRESEEHMIFVDSYRFVS